MRARFSAFFKSWHQYTLWTASIVAVMSAVVFATLAEPPAGFAAQDSTLVSTAASFKIDSREPAAVSPNVISESLGGTKGLQAVELTLPCEPTKNNFVNAVSAVRLTGSNCGPKREISSVEVLNDANGFSATVFFPDPNSFTTDYVALMPGENNIKLLVIYKNGERDERHYPVTRAQKE